MKVFNVSAKFGQITIDETSQQVKIFFNIAHSGALFSNIYACVHVYQNTHFLIGLVQVIRYLFLLSKILNSNFVNEKNQPKKLYTFMIRSNSNQISSMSFQILVEKNTYFSIYAWEIINLMVNCMSPEGPNSLE